MIDLNVLLFLFAGIYLIFRVNENYLDGNNLKGKGWFFLIALWMIVQAGFLFYDYVGVFIMKSFLIILVGFAVYWRGR